MDHRIQVVLNTMLKSEHFWLVTNEAIFHSGILKIQSLSMLLTLIRKRLLIWSFVHEHDIYILLEKIWKSEFGRYPEPGLKLKHSKQMILSCKMKMTSTLTLILKKTMNKQTSKKMKKSKWLTCYHNMLVLFMMKRQELQSLQKL